MPEPLANVLPPQDRNDTTPVGGAAPATPATPAEPAISTETQKILDTLKGLGDQVQGLAERVDEIELPPPPPPPTPEVPPKWTPQSWDDFPALAAKKAEEAVTKVITEREEEAEEAKIREQEEQRTIDKQIDVKVSELESKGKIPPVKNAEDQNDPGRVFRRQLYGLAANMDTLNLEAVTEEVIFRNAHGFQYDIKAGKWLRVNPVNPGQGAPVGSSNTGGAGAEGPSYETIHKARSLSELARRAGM